MDSLGSSIVLLTLLARAVTLAVVCPEERRAVVEVRENGRLEISPPEA